NFIYRHTMGRPRELVLMGNYLHMHVIGEPDYKELDEKRKTEKIRAAVYRVSNDIIEVYLNEIIPRFDKSLLSDFIKFIQSNVIPAKHIMDNHRNLLEHYFSIGIIGFVQKDIFCDDRNTFIQKFLPASEYSYKGEISLPNTKYFLTHPCLDSYLKRTLDFRFYNMYNIIGNGRRFIDRPELTQIYDVALSYSSSERSFVEEVADYLNQKDIKVFYDVIQREKTWGNNLEVYLQHIYRNAARYCVLFVSKSYLEKKWTRFELEQALDRYASNKGRYLLPIKFENAVYDFGNMAFLNADEVSPFEIAEYVEAVL
ncbi:MAG: toll/interleukin-1 receptor domain-containing protein, partial [Bacteroidota bacterium]